jgi:hypothetical protein
MSGIKENQNVTTVTRLLTSPVIAFNELKNHNSELGYNFLSGTEIEFVSPSILKKQISIVSQIQHNSISEVRMKMVSQLNHAISYTKLNSAQAIQGLNEDFAVINNSIDIEQMKAAYKRISETCIKEHSIVFKKAIVQTVELAMKEVGFSSVVIKQIATTPVIIAKNKNGQTIRTEINETSEDGKINLVRIQSGIAESECESLNKRINASLNKNGLQFEKYCVIEIEKKKSSRTFNFSDQICDQKITRPLIKNLL